MPQIHLPIFPPGMTSITDRLGFERRDGRVTYFVGLDPVFQHAEDDLRTFRMITSQFVVQGSAKQADIARAFGIPPITVKRYVRIFREKGPAGFFAPRGTRGPAVLTPDVVEALQQKLDEGVPKAEAARDLGLKPNTVSKAVSAGRLRGKKKRHRQGPTPCHR